MINTIPIDIRWAKHFVDRFVERAPGVSLFGFSMEAQRRLDQREYEEYWELDPVRGEVKNFLVRASEDAWVLFRLDRFDSAKYHAVSVLTEPQYLFNARRVWCRTQERLRQRIEAGDRRGRSPVRPLTHTPFESLKKEAKR
jgi:hypothetical protein